jgi:hypothetical protein
MGQPANDAVTAWLAQAVADARRRGLGDLAPLVESLGVAVASLRTADWNDDAGGATRRDSRDQEQR